MKMKVFFHIKYQIFQKIWQLEMSFQSIFRAAENVVSDTFYEE